MKRVVNQSKNIHSMFQRGKILISALELAHSPGIKLKMTQGNCATRFWSSQFRQFINIIDGFAVYAEAFRSFGYNECKEYEILGKDFIIDLCMITDVLKIVMDLMIRVQDLSQPCWKICSWWPRVKNSLQSLKDEDVEEPTTSLKFLSDIIVDIVMKREFKGQKLVEGLELILQDDEVNNWVARDIQDCKEDFLIFVEDITQSIQKRYESCVSDMCSSLQCLDLEQIVTLCSDYRKNGKPIIEEVELEEYGRVGFHNFIEFVCAQDQIRAAIEDGMLEIDPGLSHVLHRKLKQVLKEFLCINKTVMSNLFLAVSAGHSKPVPLSSQLPDSARTLQEFYLVLALHSLDNHFEMRFSYVDKDFEVIIDESVIVKLMYID